MWMFLILLLPFVVQDKDIDLKQLIGTWQVEKVVYLDHEPVRPKDGEQMIWKFTNDGICINLTHQSETDYSIKGDQLNLDGYCNTIEKLTDQQLVIRENKQFFIRRIVFKKIN